MNSESRIEMFKKMQQRSYDKSLDFWKGFDLPFEFHVGIKEVLSGLSESSWGNGEKSNSRIHVIVDEDISVGRLKRKKGEFLCSQQKRYANWSGQNDEQLYHYFGATKYVPEITCKACLERSRRIQKSIK